MSKSELPAAANHVARAVAELVGDACLVLLADENRDTLRPAAVAHRDRERRDALSVLTSSARAVSDDWAGNAFVKNIAFRLRHADAAAVVSREHGIRLNVAAAVIAPLRIDGEPAGVVIAFRDSLDFAYSREDARRVEQLAAGAGPAGVGRVEPSSASAPDPGRIVEHAPVALWATDADGLTTYVNQSACELAGIPAGAVLGAPLAAFLDRDAGGRDQILTCPDGRELWVSVTSNAISDTEGRPQGTVYSLAEVGTRRSAEITTRLRASALEAVADFAEVALSGEDFGVLAEEAIAIAAETLSADYAALAEISPGRATCVPRALRGWPRELLGQTLPLPERSPAALCLDEDGPVVVRDLAMLEHVECGPAAAQIRARSCVCVAIGDGTGVLSVHSKMPGAFSSQDLSFLGLLTATLAARWRPVAEAAPALVLTGER